MQDRVDMLHHLFALLFCVGSASIVLHLSVDGIDQGMCGKAAPCGTFTYAYQMAQHGDTVLFSVGRYTKGLVMSHFPGAVVEKNLNIVGEIGAVLTVPNNQLLWLIFASNVTVSNLIFEGGNQVITFSYPRTSTSKNSTVNSAVVSSCVFQGLPFCNDVNEALIRSDRVNVEVHNSTFSQACNGINSQSLAVHDSDFIQMQATVFLVYLATAPLRLYNVNIRDSSWGIQFANDICVDRRFMSQYFDMCR